MAISLEDARLHGGWLQAWGQPGQGSNFVLTLPRTAGTEVASFPVALDPTEMVDDVAATSATVRTPGGATGVERVTR